MENPDYRAQLADILDYFNGKRFLTATEVAEYCQKSRQYIAKRYGIDKNGITAPILARRMCEH